MDKRIRRVGAACLAVVIITGVFLLHIGTLRDAKAAELLPDAEITWGEVLYFNGHYDTEFFVNGELAFCMEANKEVPDDGQQMVQEYYNDPNILRTLYYGWGGPAQWDGFTGLAHGYVTTSRVLSFYYGGLASLPGGALDEYEEAFISYLNTKPYITAAGFEPGYVKAKYDMEQGRQITPSISVKGSSTLSFAIPKGITTVNETSGTSHTESIVLNGECSIHFVADANFIQGGKWSVDHLGSTQEYAPVMLKVKDGNAAKQHCVMLKYIGENQQLSTGFMVEWESLGRIRLCKKSADEEITKEKTDYYSLEGAVYDLYDQDGKVIDTMITDANGEAVSKWLPYGKYMVKEKESPLGYLVDHHGAEINLQVDNEIFTVNEQPQFGKIRLQKEDAETNESLPQGNGSLEGAVYEITDDNGKVVDELKTDQEGRAESKKLPLGKYKVKETEAPDGYLLDETEYEVILTSKDREQEIFLHLVNSKEQVIRGDLKFTKIDGRTEKAIEGVLFQITSHTTKESHVIVTDENGNASTADSGIWFGGGGPDGDRGALPFDTYTIEELRCEANEGYELIPPFDIVIDKENQTVDLGVMTNERPEEIKIPVKRQSVKTGDESIWRYLLPAAAALGVGIILLVSRIQKKRKE